MLYRVCSLLGCLPLVVFLSFASLCSCQGAFCPLRSSFRCGGDNEIRTRDLLRARQALSQLSYIPDTGQGTGPED